MIRFFAKHPTAANLLMIFILALGLFSVASLRRETFPDFSEDKVEITVVYPGATTEDVEDAVCRRIEDAVDGVNYVKEITAEARENMGRVIVEMEQGADIQVFLADIKTEVDAIDDFPDKTEDPVVKELNRTDQVVSIAVSGPMQPGHWRHGSRIFWCGSPMKEKPPWHSRILWLWPVRTGVKFI